MPKHYEALQRAEEERRRSVSRSEPGAVEQSPVRGQDRAHRALGPEGEIDARDVAELDEPRELSGDLATAGAALVREVALDEQDAKRRGPAFARCGDAPWPVGLAETGAA